MDQFYAKVETINTTTYDTFTVRVLKENKEGEKLREHEDYKLTVDAV